MAKAKTEAVKTHESKESAIADKSPDLETVKTIEEANALIAEAVEELPPPVCDGLAKLMAPPNPQKPTLGRVVIYKLSAQNAAEINRRRTTPLSIAERIKLNWKTQVMWPLGAQAHIGNEVAAGDEFPAIVVRTWSDTCVNIQVFLDGCDTYWATSVSDGEHNGMWHWPPRV